MRVSRTTTRRRRGSLLVEVTIGTVLLAIIMTVTVQVLGFAAHERGAAERRQRALLEAGNLMERITAYSFDEVTAERVRRITLSESARQALAGAELAIDVAAINHAADDAAKRISVRIRWHNRAGLWEGPVRLTSWINRRRAGS
jgi:Tfp pilus assembly protein PilV